ncbi:MAG: acyl-CoA thioesterase-1 [Saprospiraceae bacterium]|jgi:acyl-CoA thioesterase-1
MKALLKLTVFWGLLFWGACNVAEKDQKTSSPAVDSDPVAVTPIAKEEKIKSIVFFGNSLSAGYGVNPEECFAGLIEKRVDSLGLPYKVINAGLSGETTAGGESRIDWILRQPVDVFILELGGNDALRGIQPASSYKNLQSIIDKTKAKYPEVKIIIAGMMAPPNMGIDFTTKFKDIFPKIAEESKSLLIPFLLEGVAAIPSLNQADGIHPNPQGHKIVAENIWGILKEIL